MKQGKGMERHAVVDYRKNGLLGHPILWYYGVDLHKIPHLVIRPEELHSMTNLQQLPQIL